MKLHTIYFICIVFTSLALITLCFLPGIQLVPTHLPSLQPTPVIQNPGPTQVSQGSPTPVINLADMIKATVQIYGLKSTNG